MERPLEERLAAPGTKGERRTDSRRRTFKSGKVLFDRCAIDCIIRNLSAEGACLLVATTKGLPTHFALFMDTAGIHRICRVAWMTETQVGVAFLQ